MGGMHLQLYHETQVALSQLAIAIFAIGAGIVFRIGRPSSGRNLIGAGLVIHCLAGITGRVIQSLRWSRTDLTSDWAVPFYVVIGVAEFMILCGIVQLFRRNAFLELKQKERNE